MNVKNNGSICSPKHRVEQRAHGVLDLLRCEHAHPAALLILVELDAGQVLECSGVMLCLQQSISCICI